MAKKSKRSRNGSPKNKKNRSPQGALGQGLMSQGPASQASALARDVRDSSAPEATSGEQIRGDQKRAPESERRRRAAGGILPPPREAPSDPASDEISIPPITTPAFGDSSASHGLDPNELEDSFFVRRAAVEAHAHQAHHDDVEQQVDPRTAQKRTAAAQARRAHLTGYVKWTVVAAAALLAIGIGRVELQGKPEFGPPPPIIHTAMAAVVDNTPHSIAPRDPNAPPPATPLGAPEEESQAAADQAVAALENQATQPVANDAVQAAPAAIDSNAQKPADPVAQPAAAAPAAATPDAPVAPANAPAAAPVVSDKTAAQEKKSASQLLEHGHAKGAIEAGERSVALDATDGEAWLVLGAAYQEVGKNADAKRCFNSCIKEGKRGPISECRAMLQ